MKQNLGLLRYYTVHRQLLKQKKHLWKVLSANLSALVEQFQIYLLHYADEQSYKATSKLKKHVFDMCVMNAIGIFNKQI